MAFDLPLSANQPQWFPVCLREILSRAAFLTNWEWYFIGRVRPKIENGIALDNWEQEKLFRVHKFVMLRKKKPEEKYRPPTRRATKTMKEFYV